MSAATTTPSAASTSRYYHYDPSVAAAVVALVLFFCTTALHTFQMLRTKTWYFIPFVIGGVSPTILIFIPAVECAGYIARTYNASQTPNWVNGAYILEQIGILIAPAFLAASMYILFGRVIRLTDGDSRSLIKQKRLTGVFVGGDVLSLLLQAAGGGQSTSKDSNTRNLGQKLLEVGLFVQIISFGTFIFCATIFHYRITKRSTIASATPSNPWQKHLYVLYVTGCLIFGRCIFRVVMYIQGPDGSIESSEALFYIFDSLFVWTVMVLFNIIHPSEVRALLHGHGRVAWRGEWKSTSGPSNQGSEYNLVARQ